MSTREHMRSGMRERARQAATERTRGGGGLTTLALPPDMSLLDVSVDKVDIVKRLDILPFVLADERHPEVRGGHRKLGDLWYELTYSKHRAVGAAEEDFICPESVGERCPLDEEFRAARKNGRLSDDEYKALSKELRGSERQMFYAIDLDAPDEGVQLFDISYFNFGKLLDKELNAQDEAEPFFADLEDGLTLKARFSPRRIADGKPFPEATRIDFVPRKRPYPAAVMEGLKDLVTLLKVSTAEQIEAAWRGTDNAVEKEQPPARRGPDGRRAAAMEQEEELDMSPPRRGKGAPPPAEEPEESACTACGGTGKNTKGRTCPICWGSGVTDEAPDRAGTEPPAEREEQPPSTPARTRTAAKAPARRTRRRG